MVADGQRSRLAGMGETCVWKISGKDRDMSRPTLLVCVLFASSFLALTGCGAGAAAIPLGEWKGTGTYVDYEAALAKDQPVALEQQARDKEYETTLSIRETKALGRDALVFAIHSKRGKLLNVGGEETKGEITLVKLKELKEGSGLYAVLTSGTGEAPKAEADPARAIASATAIHSPRGLVVQVYYGRPTPNDPSCFTDTFHFLGDKVIKTGSFFTIQTTGAKQKLIKVWWVEELRRVR